MFMQRGNSKRHRYIIILSTSKLAKNTSKTINNQSKILKMER